ncbi:hypothetical protein JYG30_11820 [Fibrella sp. USSR17]
MKTLLIASLIILIFACKDQNALPNTCQVTNPITDLPWLKDRIAKATNSGDLTVSQATYQGQSVFTVDWFIGPDAGSYVIYRCDGSIVCSASTTIAGQQDNCSAIPQELKNSAVIFESKR